jgi:CHASE3 domain sensor protein
VRVSSAVENDIAALDNAYRGRLLTKDGAYVETFNRLQTLFLKDSEELTGLIGDNVEQKRRVLQLRKIIQNWLKKQFISHD